MSGSPLLTFRAWDDDDKVWLLGYEPSKANGFSLFGENILFGEWGSIINKFLLRDVKSPYALKVTQSTGAVDSNGIQIYGGDIVTWMLKGSITPGEVFWKEGGWWIRDHRGGNTVRLWKASSLTVIGNIFDSKELLAQGQ